MTPTQIVSLISLTLASAVGFIVGVFAAPSPTPPPIPKSHFITYSVQLKDGRVKQSHVHMTETQRMELKGFEAIIQMIANDTNTIPGSVVILNALPLY